VRNQEALVANTDFRHARLKDGVDGEHASTRSQLGFFTSRVHAGHFGISPSWSRLLAGVRMEVAGWRLGNGASDAEYRNACVTREVKKPSWLRVDAVLASRPSFSRAWGSAGVRDEALLDSATGKARNLFRTGTSMLIWRRLRVRIIKITLH